MIEIICAVVHAGNIPYDNASLPVHIHIAAGDHAHPCEAISIEIRASQKLERDKLSFMLLLHGASRERKRKVFFRNRTGFLGLLRVRQLKREADNDEKKPNRSHP